MKTVSEISDEKEIIMKTVSEISNELGVCPTNLNYYIRLHKIPHSKIIARCRLFDEAAERQIVAAYRNRRPCKKAHRGRPTILSRASA